MKADADNGSPFTPPPSSATPTVLIALALGALLFAGYRAMEGWSAQQGIEPTPKTTVATAPGPAGPPVPPTVRIPASDDEKAPVVESGRETQPAWIRCEAGGEVTYSDAGCVGATQMASSRNTQAALSTMPTDKGTAGTTTLYRCKAYSGVVFWSGNHCNQKKALVDRMVEVPSGLALQEQIVVAERSLPQVPPSAPALGAPRAEAVSQGPTRQEQCETLKKAIERIDAWTRQPLTALEQDLWRSKRQEARDRQFALRC